MAGRYIACQCGSCSGAGIQRESTSTLVRPGRLPSSFIINASVTSVIWRSPRQNAKLHEFMLQNTLIFSRGRTTMSKLKGLVVVMAVLVSTAWGQSLVPKSEFTGGYTYGSMDQNVGLGSTGRLNANGWNTGATAFLNNWFGIEGNVAGLSPSESLPAVAGVTGRGSGKHHTFAF